MRRSFLRFVFGSAFVFAALPALGQTAKLQVIHNAADPAAAVVDIYVNGSLAIPDLAFRKATAFLDLPAGTTLNIGVAPGTSMGVQDTLKNFQVVLTAGQKYVAVANGVLDPAQFAANPNGRSTAFTLLIKSAAKDTGAGGNVEFFALHGATDAPAVDVVARGVATLVNNALYADMTPYLAVPPAGYILDVKDSTGASTVASFYADLSGLRNASAVVFASGFLTPASNKNGPAFGLYAALANGTVVAFPPYQSARLQVIHNAADPGAASVDIYLNGGRLLDNFAFRAATPFIDAPAGVPLKIGVAGGTSTSVADTIKNFTVMLTAGQKYVAIANGVLNPGQFAANPNGRSTAFTLLVKTPAKEAGSGGNVEFFALHGATDAPAVDVVARGVATLVNNALYADMTPYLAVPPAKYVLDVKDSTGAATVASFSADLSGLANGSAMVFASGFLTPSANQNGPAFGLYAALSNGTVVAFPPYQSARVQVIHNAADPAADSVDVYINGVRALNNFAFRAATPFIELEAGVVQNIGIAPKTSATAADTLKNFPFVLTAGQRYVLIASGVLSPGSFAANPNGRSTTFRLLVKDGAKETGSGGNVEFFALHGATDAPIVDIVARNVATLVNNAGYGDITGYLAVPPAAYTLDVKDSSGSVTVATFAADLSGLANGSAVVFASGFLTPSANQNGKAFGLYAALANGTVVPFTPVTTARVQIIHNAADPGAASVDVYLNGSKIRDNFAFRTATAYLDVPAGVTVNIGIAPGTSTSASDTLKNFRLTLVAGERYLAVANGVLNPANFAANPNGKNRAFTLFLKSGMKEVGTGGKVEFVVVHGATDAPAVDVVARGAGTLVNNAFYADITNYLAVNPASYVLDVKDSSGTTTVATYTANLSGLANGSAVVFASGFLTPSTNQNGPAFGLYAALANGTVVAFPAGATSVQAFGDGLPTVYDLGQNYPNPFNPSTVIRFSLPEGQFTRLTVYNSLGQEVRTLFSGQLAAGVYTETFDASGLPSGTYFYRIDAGQFSSVKKMMLVK